MRRLWAVSPLLAVCAWDRPIWKQLPHSANVRLSLQVGNNDVDDVNIIVFRQINQFDLSGNVITSSEYLSTLWVRVLKKTQSQRER